jgi:hypothetical protein
MPSISRQSISASPRSSVGDSIDEARGSFAEDFGFDGFGFEPLPPKPEPGLPAILSPSGHSSEQAIVDRRERLKQHLGEARKDKNIPGKKIKELTCILVEVTYESTKFATTDQRKIELLNGCLETYASTYGTGPGDRPGLMRDIAHHAHHLYFMLATGVSTYHKGQAFSEYKLGHKGTPKPPEQVDMLAYLRSRSMLALVDRYEATAGERLHDEDGCMLGDVYPKQKHFARLPVLNGVDPEELLAWELEHVTHEVPPHEWTIPFRWNVPGLQPFIRSVHDAAWKRAAKPLVQESLGPFLPDELVRMTFHVVGSSTESDAADDPAA